jgi:predicted permease
MSWFSKLQNALHPQRLDEDLAEEMRDHLERRADAIKAHGLNAEEARRQAQLRFGSTTRFREQSRDFRLWTGLESTLQDVRYAWRGMRKGPIFASTAVLSLALAIGANTAIYSIVDAAILRPLPVYEPDRLFRLASPGISQPGSPAAEERLSFSYPMYQQFVGASKPAARLALFSSSFNMEAQRPGATTPAEKVIVQFVSGEAFEILGVTPAVGRLFSAEDDHLPRGRNVVLSYHYWRSRFHADPSVVGQFVQIEGKAYEITGVAREGFFGVEPGRFVDFWQPATLYEARALVDPGWNWFQILGRLNPGVSREQVAALLQPSFHNFVLEMLKRFPTVPPVIRKQFLQAAIRVHSAATGVSDFRRDFSHSLWIVFGVAGGILLIACANVASLLLARSTARASEMAMRISLGAVRARLIRQLLTESLLLSLMAGALGWVLARVIAPALVRMLSQESEPVQFVLAINTRVLFFCIAVSTLSAVLFGLIPAWQASRAQPMFSLRAGAGQTSKLRLGKIFVSVQVACAFCLVIVGAAFLFSLGNLLHVKRGFDARNIAVLKLTARQSSSDLVADSVADPNEEVRRRNWMFQLQSRVSEQRGVHAAALAWWPIFQGTGWSEQITIPGKSPSDREEILYRISPGYFAALRTPLLAGRDFNASDSTTHNPAPAIVNEAFARRYFDTLNVLGRQFSYRFMNHQVRNITVGVAADAHYYDLRNSVDPLLYLPVEGNDGFTLYVRSLLPLGSLVRVVDREAHAIDPNIRIREVTTLETLVGNTLLREKLLANVGGAFAFFGLLLAAIGLFGLLSYSVGRRTKEIGIRAALGAQRAQIVTLVLKDVSGLLSGGLVIGLAAALAFLTVFRSLLFGIRSADPLVIGTAITLFLLTALLAAGMPARCASTVDPLSALREE